MSTKNNTPTYLIDEFQMEMLKAIANRLCGGSDAMRDEGNILWTVFWQIQDNLISENEEDEK
jgi:hypothetical protein